ncbi:TPA: hypothetical protein ACGU7E_004613 [Vibrio vulnificus]|uniref:hypothetical protein n=1 Tax=Vibrio vulnificus TaxID=672 RepID=UPI0028CF8BBE|nr:hypothetical protein [Vibrio vulnificus]HDY8187711.1 hypothetical protein [Vibrio vulnificus]
MDMSSFGIGFGLAFSICILFTKFFLPSYLKEKGKNLATKEDISSITEAVEKVKSFHGEKLQELIHQNNIWLEMQKSHNQLKLVAPEKRMQAHQEAFELWRKIISNMHTDQRVSIVMECQDWYNKNCLYLGEEARKAFSTAYGALAIHNDLLQDRSSSRDAKENYFSMINAGETIVSGVELPPLNADVSVVLQKEKGKLVIETL